MYIINDSFQDEIATSNADMCATLTMRDTKVNTDQRLSDIDALVHAF